MPSDAAIRVYRSLLWLYPLEFREHFTQEICLLLADNLRAQINAPRRFAVWLAAVAAIFIDAPREHYHMIRQDVSYALRTMRREKATTAIAVLVLTLGIGSTATVFNLVNGLLLHPLPFPEQDRMVYVKEASGKTGAFAADQQQISGNIAFPNYLDLAAGNRTLESFALYKSFTVTLRQNDAGAEQIKGAFGTGPLFRVLGVQPLLGRTFTADDDLPKAPAVAVLSEDLWRNRYAADPAILGKTIVLGIEPTRIVGVMPRVFHFPNDAQFWMPLRLSVEDNTRTDYWLEGVARLRPGIGREQAQADLRAVMQQITHDNPTDTTGQTVDVLPFKTRVTGSVKPAVLTLMGAVSFVLLIACANIASLLLVRATGRQREIAVRGALGASRSRVFRQFAVESALLGLLGAIGGMAMASAALPALLRLTPANALPIWADFRPDLRSWIFIALAASGTAIFVGVLPALTASRFNLVDALKDGGRTGSAGAGSNRLRACLVAAEVAMSVLLLSGACLMIRTFVNLENQDAGFQIANLTTFSTDAPKDRYPFGPAAAHLTRRMLQEFAALPGIVSVAATSTIPIDDNWGRSLTVEGAPLLKLRDAPMVSHAVITSGYFKTMGIPIVEGRDFNESDASGPLVTIVDAALARHYWPNRSAIGKRVRYGPPENNEPWRIVVGVAGQVRNLDLREIGRYSVYIPYSKGYQDESFGWVARTSPGLADPGLAVRRRIAQIDRNIAVSRVSTMREIVDRSLWQERFFATLLGFFAALATLMATVGLYGVMAYTVSRRTHELGIRVALGASAREIRGMVLLQSGRLVGAGLAIGITAALFLTRLLEKQLYGVKANDPATLLAVSALLAAAALSASYLPARRATRVDPMLALREE